jgi:hypothetical protein
MCRSFPDGQGKQNEDRAWGFMTEDRVVMRSECNVSCLDTSGYVTAGNSQLVSGYVCFVGKNDTHITGTNNMTIRVYIGNYIHHCVYNILELIKYNF